MTKDRSGRTPLKKRVRDCNLLEVLEAWTRILDSGYGVDVIYLDYKKAFDTVPHRRLLQKLSMFGIDDFTLQWILSFLEDRQMRVTVRGSCSHWVEAVSYTHLTLPTKRIV